MPATAVAAAVPRESGDLERHALQSAIQKIVEAQSQAQMNVAEGKDDGLAPMIDDLIGVVQVCMRLLR